MPRPSISAIVLTWNVAHKLRPCLESLDFVDEILVVDSGSDDDTVEIAREYTERILSHTPYENYAAQSTWALEQTEHAWTLICDSDERVTPQLREEILQTLETGPECDAYHLPRQNHFMNREIRHGGWGGDTVVRFFNKERCRFIPRQVHPELQVDGQTGRLTGALIHEPYANLHEWMERFDRYARWGAENARAKGHRANWVTLGIKPPAKFLKIYFLRLGFLDGLPGLVIAMFAMFSMFMRYMHLLEDERNPSRATPPPKEN